MNKVEINKEKAEEFTNDYVERLKYSNAKIKELLSNTNYLKWLERFTIEHSFFTINDWIYLPDAISKDDSEQVDNLCYLYDGIKRYAIKNYVYPIKYGSGGYYRIKLDNIGYEIGMFVGQGTSFFCARVALDNDLDYIDFNDIMNNKMLDNVDFIKQKLDNFSNMVLELYEKGIPVDAIVNTFDNTLTRIKEDEKESTKLLKFKPRKTEKN